MSRGEGLPIADCQLPNESVPDAASATRQSAIGNWQGIPCLLFRGWVHLLLLCGVGIFIFPFIWMVATSLKTDDELANSSNWWSSFPRFHAEGAFELRDPQIRTLDQQIHNVACKWAVESGDATTTTPEPGVLRVIYRFATPDAPRIILRTDIDFPGVASILHKLILPLQPDESWHRLDIILEAGGRRFRSVSSTYLAQRRAVSAVFQPMTFDDTTLQPKSWTSLRSDAAPVQTSHSTLRVIITPSSTLAATWGKILRNYQRVFYFVPFWRYVANSLLLVGLITVGSVFSSAFVAYAFARLNWPGRSAALLLLLSTMMLPVQVTMVPSFMIWRTLGWYNTLSPVWFPAFFGSAFFIFLMIQHMKTIPRELEEAARLDGLNAVQTWYYIIVPQVKPVAAAVAIMAFMWSWNEFLGPLIYLRDQTKFPLSLGLFNMRLENFGDWPMIMAGNVLMTLPVMLLFFICQRYFIQGMTMSGMKG
jgi:multiple sugar transport system permease protein